MSLGTRRSTPGTGVSVITPWDRIMQDHSFKQLEAGRAKTEEVGTDRSEQMGLWVPAVSPCRLLSRGVPRLV